MYVTIIGAGNMAKAIGTRLVAGGHNVNLHVRDTKKGEALAEELRGVAHNNDAVEVKRVGSTTDDVVILAVPYDEIENLAEDYDDELIGKIVVDPTNPIELPVFELVTPSGIAGAEEVAELLPEAIVIKAFNTIFSGTLLVGKVDDKPLDVFIAGDDDDAKRIIAQLATDSGLRPLDAGPLSNARHLEGFQLLHMMLQDQLGSGWMSAVRIIP